MKISKSNILIAIVLLGTIAHAMVLMNGLWSNALWLTSALVVLVPVLIHKYSTPSKRELRRRQLTAEI